MRHILIHRGCEDSSLEADDFSIERIEDYIKLSYDFVRWVEDNLTEYNLRESFNRTYPSVGKDIINIDDLSQSPD